MDMRLQSQTKTTRILPGRLWPLFTLSAHSWISQANEAATSNMVHWSSEVTVSVKLREDPFTALVMTC